MFNPGRNSSLCFCAAAEKRHGVPLSPSSLRAMAAWLPNSSGLLGQKIAFFFFFFFIKQVAVVGTRKHSGFGTRWLSPVPPFLCPRPVTVSAPLRSLPWAWWWHVELRWPICCLVSGAPAQGLLGLGSNPAPVLISARTLAKPFPKSPVLHPQNGQMEPKQASQDGGWS
jgi:hypothetical protein